MSNTTASELLQIAQASIDKAYECGGLAERYKIAKWILETNCGEAGCEECGQGEALASQIVAGAHNETE